MKKVVKGIVNFFKYLWDSMTVEEETEERYGSKCHTFGTPKPMSHWAKISQEYKDIEKAEAYLHTELAKEQRAKISFDELVQYRYEVDQVLRKTRNYA